MAEMVRVDLNYAFHLPNAFPFRETTAANMSYARAFLSTRAIIRGLEQQKERERKRAFGASRIEFAKSFSVTL